MVKKCRISGRKMQKRSYGMKDLPGAPWRRAPRRGRHTSAARSIAAGWPETRHSTAALSVLPEGLMGPPVGPEFDERWKMKFTLLYLMVDGTWWWDLVYISNELLYLVMGGMTVSIPNELLNIFSSITLYVNCKNMTNFNSNSFCREHVGCKEDRVRTSLHFLNTSQ